MIAEAKVSEQARRTAGHCSAAAVALAWAIRSGNVIAIRESGSPVHIRENAEPFR
jgi:diketogulonate reductase-like aldo/keto reductase